MSAAEESEDVEVLRHRVEYLQEALAAITSGGVDAVVLGEAEEGQVYTLTSADKPYRVIVEHMGEGAVTVSEGGVILFANPQIARFLGVSTGELVGRDLSSFVSADQQPAVAALLGARDDSTRRAELVLIRPDGLDVPFLVAATDLEVEDVLVHCLVLTDLTAQKEAERQQKEAAAQRERQRVAREVNDTIVQGLVTAEMAIDLEKYGYARKVIAATSARARSWIGELASDDPMRPGGAVRRSPASSDADAP